MALEQPPKMWKFIVIPIAIGLGLFTILGGVAYFLMFGSSTNRYNNAVMAFNSGDYQSAAAQFEKLGDYRDSKARSQEALTIMHYNNGKEAFALGDYDKAKEEYDLAGKYENADLLAQEAVRAGHYAKGASLATAGNYDGAVDEYLKSEYKDYKDKVFDIYVAKGDKELGDKNFDQALESYKKAATYKDTKEPVRKCYYEMGEDAFSKKDTKNAVSYYEQAGDYKDAPEKIKSIYYDLGTEALGKNDLDKAAEYLKLAGNFKDAATISKEAFYLKGTNLVSAKDYKNAAEYFKLAGDYKDANTLYTDSIYNQGAAALSEKKYEEAKALFESCGNYKYAQDLVKVCQAENEFESGSVNEGISLYSKVSKKAKVTGFDVQARKAFCVNWKTVDRASGVHGVYSNSVYVKRITKTGGFRQMKEWFFVGLDTRQAVEIKYSINDDGTFNITGGVGWGRFLNFAESRENVQSEIHISRFELSHVKKFPTTIKLSGGAKLTFKNGTFTVKYSKNKKSGNKKFQYRSTIKYR